MGPPAGVEEVGFGTVVTVELGTSLVVAVLLDVVRVGASVVVVDVPVVVGSVVVVVRVGVRVRLVVRLGVAGASVAGVTWVRAGEPAGGGRTRT
ncbi:hypothetical protein [Oryzihumus leptocrescens]|uniref:Uncharacterized protein n=1 Tax=Oryzihumus leptocrescens TaxID=297536 RepID=A0A542ZKS0_9MICO|nr:hypothetical protein [Oryzihumus leptocrescens]TQL60936.1 hypothetical protein FB474_2336 [Oryzihumus leptocrescens]